MKHSSKAKNILIITVPCILLVFVLSISYAAWQQTQSQSGLNKLDSLNCLSTTLTDVTKALKLDGEFPISNAEGMKKDPYTFTVTNNCDKYIYIDINLEVLPVSTLSANYVRAAINPVSSTVDSSNIITNNELGTATIAGATSYTIKKDIIISGNESTTYDLRLWMDYNTTVAQGSNKYFETKIVVNYSPAPIPVNLTINVPSSPKGIYSTNFSGATWNHKTATLNISSLSAGNDINVTNLNSDTGVNFANYIMSLAGTNQGDGKLIKEMIEDYQFGEKENSSYYLNITNDATYPFSWDDTSKTWTSSNKLDSTTSTITFTSSKSGNLAVCYSVSSEANYDKATFYVDNVQIVTISGVVTDCTYLGNLTTSNVIKIIYSKDSSQSSGSDIVSFSVNPATIDIKSAGYRYQGKSPNNWLLFNGEYWRIIGVFDSDTHSKTGENLAKIIRESSIGQLVLNKTSNSNWSVASLKNLLNDNYYYGVNEETITNCAISSSNVPGNCNFRKDGIIHDIYRNMIENVTWKFGGASSSGYPSAIFYKFERGTAVSSGGASNSSGKVGLMYPSDYGFSVLASDCPRSTILSGYSVTNCVGKSWLQSNGSDWTLTSQNIYNYAGFHITNGGGLSNSNVTNAFQVRPVVYLKSNIVKQSGDGSFENPYIIME